MTDPDPDLLGLIFNLLAPNQIVVCSGVCKLWSSIALSDSIWKLLTTKLIEPRYQRDFPNKTGLQLWKTLTLLNSNWLNPGRKSSCRVIKFRLPEDVPITIYSMSDEYQFDAHEFWLCQSSHIFVFDLLKKKYTEQPIRTHQTRHTNLKVKSKYFGLTQFENVISLYLKSDSSHYVDIDLRPLADLGPLGKHSFDFTDDIAVTVQLIEPATVTISVWDIRNGKAIKMHHRTWKTDEIIYWSCRSFVEIYPQYDKIAFSIEFELSHNVFVIPLSNIHVPLRVIGSESKTPQFAHFGERFLHLFGQNGRLMEYNMENGIETVFKPKNQFKVQEANLRYLRGSYGFDLFLWSADGDDLLSNKNGIFRTFAAGTRVHWGGNRCGGSSRFSFVGVGEDGKLLFNDFTPNSEK